MELQKYTREDVYNMLGNMSKRQEEYEERHKKSAKEYEERQKESAKEYEERQKEYEERQKKAEKETAELKRVVREVSRSIGGLGNSIGDVTEDYFYSSISTTLNVNGIQYDTAKKNMIINTPIKQGEYDIVLINSTRLLVIEVKHKLEIKHIEKFANKHLPLFKELFPEYKDFVIYGAVYLTLVLLEGYLLPQMGDLGETFAGVFHGFNFLIGILYALLFKKLLVYLDEKGKNVNFMTNNYILSNISSIAFNFLIAAAVLTITIESIKELLGHWSVVQTEAYAHNNSDRLLPQVSRLNKLLEK